jgi:23S rRNA (uracil1939-C5)-methyltransferase
MQKQFEIDIYGLAYGGEGVGKLEGKVCFVEGALPGERVRFSKQSEKKSFVRGAAAEIIMASEERIDPVCPYYGTCGGCQYQHLKYEKEVLYKAEQFKDIFRRIGGFDDFGFRGITPSSREYGYRSSITLHNSTKGYGYFTKDNRTIIAVKRCPLAADTINTAISTLSSEGGKRDVIIKCDSSDKAWISNRQGQRFFKDLFLGTELTFSPLAFSQSNKEIATFMVEALRAWMLEEDRGVLFDLYSGVGFFGMLMRDLFENVVGIDNNGVAIDCAATSKKDLSAENIKFYRGEVEDMFPACYERARGRENAILIDPPRSGISGKLFEYLAKLEGARSLYYISCDPATLARDAKLLTQAGSWTLDRVAVYDMFPRTKHIESMALFKRRSQGRF